MNGVLLLLVCIVFIVSILTAGREHVDGYRDNGEEEI